MATSVRTTAWTTSWGGNLCMFRSEVNGHHEDQEVCLKVFPPQITAGETAVAQLESTHPLRRPDRDGGASWRLFHGDSQLGASDSYAQQISFRFDQPGTKGILATTDRLGFDRRIIARTDLVVHSLVDGEVDYIVRNLDQFGASGWFRSVIDRHHDDAYKEHLDLLLGRYLVGEPEAIRKTAFTLLTVLHERALRGIASKSFRRNPHLVDDVLQEANSRAWRSIERFQAGRRFGSWIHQILLNACRDARKANDSPLGIVDRETTKPDQAIDAIDAIDLLDHLTREFKPEDLKPLILRHGHDMGYIDITRTLKIQVNSPDATRVTTVRRQVERVENELRSARGPIGEMGEKGGSHA